jgi:hypothetical protein
MDIVELSKELIEQITSGASESDVIQLLTDNYQALQLQQTGVSDCTHENTSFKHIRCNVCDDCGDVVEIDV